MIQRTRMEIHKFKKGRKTFEDMARDAGLTKEEMDALDVADRSKVRGRF